MIRSGTVIHATLRSEDLIPAFVEELSRVIEHGMPSPHADHPHNVRYVGMLHEKLGEIERASAKTGYFDSEDPMWDIEWLFDELNNVAPEGMYFGAIEGDGSDFGWWTAEYDA